MRGLFFEGGGRYDLPFLGLAGALAFCVEAGAVVGGAVVGADVGSFSLFDGDGEAVREVLRLDRVAFRDNVFSLAFLVAPLPARTDFVFLVSSVVIVLVSGVEGDG